MARKTKGKKSKKEEVEEETPDLESVDQGENSDDSSQYSYDGSDGDDSQGDDGSDVYVSDAYEDDEDDFEDQGSSDEDEELLEKQHEDDGSVVEMNQMEDLEQTYESAPRKWKSGKRSATGNSRKGTAESQLMHTDDLSSDDEDEDGTGNRIGKVPLHWYDDYDHIGYDAHGKKVAKSASKSEGDRVDQAIANADNQSTGKFVVHDALNDKSVELTQRQLEIIRRIQNGAYAHPEHDGNPDYIDYFSGVNPEVSGLNSNRYLPKSKFQPSKWEKMQVDSLLRKLEQGYITMDYLTGKVRDMNDVNKNKDPNAPFLLWTGAEEDELNMRKGPQHIAAPKAAPPGHAESYIPPDEYIPTEEELKQWEEMEVKDRPHGLLVPKKFPNLRSVGAYKHSVREAFERCLDLYLCPRVMKRRLNIDPESLVPKLPKASDLRPFPTAKCIEYKTPYDGDEAPVIRCVSCSPNGQFLASGASDGIVRLWEVETGRLLRSWDLSQVAKSVDPDCDENDDTIKPVVTVEWNPNAAHHCLLAAVGKCAVILATGTEGAHDAAITEALLSEAKSGGNVKTEKAAKAVKWHSVKSDSKPVSSFGLSSGPLCALLTRNEVASLRWHVKGDYFVTVSPKAGAPSVLIHHLSKGNSQQPFSKAKGEAQTACFHPNKPFLFVATQQHVRVYHLVKQTMVKRLISGCRWISSMDVHPSGDHLIVGSLDRRMIWFDLDLSHTPFKTLKYHERALRSTKFHHRYPLMASASDDGAVHVFHSMVYSDLMRNPLIIPVKILRGHNIRKKLGVLNLSFHPTQPWLFTAGADGRIFLYQDI